MSLKHSMLFFVLGVAVWGSEESKNATQEPAEKLTTKSFELVELKKEDLVSLRLKARGCNECNKKEWPCSSTSRAILRRGIKLDQLKENSPARSFFFCPVCKKQYKDKQPQVMICAVYGFFQKTTPTEIILICSKCNSEHSYLIESIDLKESKILIFPSNMQPSMRGDSLMFFPKPS